MMGWEISLRLGGLGSAFSYYYFTLDQTRRPQRLGLSIGGLGEERFAAVGGCEMLLLLGTVWLGLAHCVGSVFRTCVGAACCRWSAEESCEEVLLRR